MKKLLITMQIFFIFILCGCAKSDELGNNNIITAFYVDFNEQTLFEVTAEITDFTESNRTYTETAFGETVNSAYSNLMKNMKKTPYAGHSGVLVLGDGLCRIGLSETIKFFSDINIISPNINVMMTEDAFSDFIPCAIYDASKNEMLSVVPLYTLFMPENSTTVIPVIKCTDGQPEKSGGIITQNLEFKHYEDEKSCLIYRLLTNSFKDVYFNSNEILSSKCKIKNYDGTLKVQMKTEIKNLSDKSTEKTETELKEDIKTFIDDIKKHNLCNVLKNGDFNNVDINIKITVPDTGKLKDEEKKDE